MAKWWKKDTYTWIFGQYKAVVYLHGNEYVLKLWGKSQHQHPRFKTLTAARLAAEVLYS